MEVCVVCCSVLHCVAVCCSVLQCVALCCSVLQCVAVCCSVLQCVAVCCNDSCRTWMAERGCHIFLDQVIVCCSVLQCVTVCCNVLQCVAVCCSVLQWAISHMNDCVWVPYLFWSEVMYKWCVTHITPHSNVICDASHLIHMSYKCSFIHDLTRMFICTFVMYKCSLYMSCIMNICTWPFLIRSCINEVCHIWHRMYDTPHSYMSCVTHLIHTCHAWHTSFVHDTSFIHHTSFIHVIMWHTSPPKDGLIALWPSTNG